MNRSGAMAENPGKNSGNFEIDFKNGGQRWIRNFQRQSFLKLHCGWRAGEDWLGGRQDNKATSIFARVERLIDYRLGSHGKETGDRFLDASGSEEVPLPDERIPVKAYSNVEARWLILPAKFVEFCFPFSKIVQKLVIWKEGLMLRGKKENAQGIKESTAESMAGSL